MLNFRFLFVPTFLFAALFGWAQKPVLKISPEFNLPKGKALQGHLCTDASGAHYLYYYNYPNVAVGKKPKIEYISLEKYDADFKLQYAKDYRAENKNSITYGIKYFSGRFALLMSEENKAKDYVQYSLMPIEMNGNQQEKINVGKANYESRDEIPDVYWEISNDSTKLMVNTVYDNDSDDRKFSIFSVVLNKDYSPLWSKSFSLKYAEDQVEFLKSMVSNNGDMYLLARVMKADRFSKKSKNTELSYDIILFQLNKENGDIRETKIVMGNILIRGGTLANDAQGNVYCTGLYGDVANESAKGVYWIKMSPDGTPIASSKKEFNEYQLKVMERDFYYLELDNRNREKLVSGDYHKFNNIIVENDGSAVVIAEENFSVAVSATDSRFGTANQVVNYVKDIIVFKINADGIIENIGMIPKFQTSRSNYTASYAYIIKDKSIFFFYNESEKNMETPVTRPKPKVTSINYKNHATVITVMNEKGELKRQNLFPSDSMPALLVPFSCRQISPNHLFFVTQKVNPLGKTDVYLGTVTLP